MTENTDDWNPKDRHRVEIGPDTTHGKFFTIAHPPSAFAGPEIAAFDREQAREIYRRLEDHFNQRPCCPACGAVIGETWKDASLSFAVDEKVTVTGYCPECQNEFVNEPVDTDGWKP